MSGEYLAQAVAEYVATTLSSLWSVIAASAREAIRFAEGNRVLLISVTVAVLIAWRFLKPR
jgi:hypothetical protein